MNRPLVHTPHRSLTNLVVVVALVVQWLVVPGLTALHLASTEHVLLGSVHGPAAHAHHAPGEHPSVEERHALGGDAPATHGAHGHGHGHGHGHDDGSPHSSETHFEVLRVLASRTSAGSRVDLVVALAPCGIEFHAPHPRAQRLAGRGEDAPRSRPPRLTAGRSPPSLV